MERGEYVNGEISGRIFIGGKSGSGKSRAMESLLGRSSRVVIFDSNGNYWGTERCPGGFSVVRSTHQLRDLLAASIGRPLRVVYQPRSGNLQEQFEVVTYLVYKAGWLVYAVDEVDMYCTAGALSKVPAKRLRLLTPNARQFEGGLYEIANFGRHHHMAFVCTSRRPAQISRGLTSQCSELWVFRMTENNDIDYYAGILGQSNAERLRTIPDYHYMRYVDGSLSPPEICSPRKMLS